MATQTEEFAMTDAPIECCSCKNTLNGINGLLCLHAKVRRFVAQDGRNSVPACRRDNRNPTSRELKTTN